MADTRILSGASADIAEIYAFSVEQFGRAVAADYLAGLDTAFDRLRAHPQSGPVYDGVDPPIRCLTYRSHKIFYDFNGNTVDIIRILHHAMNAPRHLKK